MGSTFFSIPVKRAMPDPNNTSANGPSKRSKPAHPPLSVPQGHISFRLLCHASRIGGIIGKAGAVIKQLQQSTGAKIQIEDALTDSQDRIVTVIGPSAVSSKIGLGGSNQGEEIEVSKGQDALIKVFERILEVAAESEGVTMGVVSCRLLVDVSQAGSVIGKGGKVVEKIKKDTGSKIKVMKDNLPSCVSSSEEIVEIEGDVSSVKKALIAVSRCLQDCPHTNKLRISDSRTKETIPQEALHRYVESMPQETLHRRVGTIPQETLYRHLESIPQETLYRRVESIPQETLHRRVESIPQDTLYRRAEMIPQDTLYRRAEMIPQETLYRHAETIPQETLQRRIQDVPQETYTRPYEPVSLETLHRPHLHVNHEGIRRRTEFGPQETLPDLLIDRLPQQSSLTTSMPISSINSRFHPLSQESERASSLDTKRLQQEVTYKILCSNEKVGGIIGRGGTVIKSLQSETGASVTIGALIPDCDERLVTVAATENPESQFSPAQKAIVLVFIKAYECGIEKGLESGSKGSTITARLVVPSNQVGCLLGKGGTIITEIRKATGTGIHILKTDQAPKCITEGDQVVQISGEYGNVKDAIYHITGRVRDNLFSSNLKGAGARGSSTLVMDTSPYGRLADPQPRGLRSPGDVYHNPGQQTTKAYNLDPYEPYTLDRSASPKRWASEAHHLYPRSMTDVGRGLTSFKGGMDYSSTGSKSAIVTNTTVEIKVPEDVISSVYGENGRNLTRLREISGAKVIVHEPRLGTSDRIIVISGTPDQTQAAQSLLQAFILTGPSR